MAHKYICVWGEGYLDGEPEAKKTEVDFSFFQIDLGYTHYWREGIQALHIGESINISEGMEFHSVVRIQ